MIPVEVELLQDHPRFLTHRLDVASLVQARDREQVDSARSRYFGRNDTCHWIMPGWVEALLSWMQS
jgi:hypothetical protein